MEYRINLFKDKPDYIKKLTDDEIINVTGSVGSGKSTYGSKYRNNKDYIVIGFDSISSDNDPNTMNDDIKDLREVLLKKYKKLNLNKIEYYDDIVEFIKSKDKKGIIEGGEIANINFISKLKGTVIVKRTARFKCFYRAAYRDYKNPVWSKDLNRIGLIKRFFHCFKRRFHHIFRQKYIEEFIDGLEKFKRG